MADHTLHPPAPSVETIFGDIIVESEDGRVVLRLGPHAFSFPAGTAWSVGGFLRAHALALDPTLDPAPAPEVE